MINIYMVSNDVSRLIVHYSTSGRMVDNETYEDIEGELNKALGKKEPWRSRDINKLVARCIKDNLKIVYIASNFEDMFEKLDAVSRRGKVDGVKVFNVSNEEFSIHATDTDYYVNFLEFMMLNYITLFNREHTFNDDNRGNSFLGSFNTNSFHDIIQRAYCELDVLLSKSFFLRMSASRIAGRYSGNIYREVIISELPSINNLLCTTRLANDGRYDKMDPIEVAYMNIIYYLFEHLITSIFGVGPHCYLKLVIEDKVNEFCILSNIKPRAVINEGHCNSYMTYYKRVMKLKILGKKIDRTDNKIRIKIDDLTQMKERIVDYAKSRL